MIGQIMLDQMIYQNLSQKIYPLFIKIKDGKDLLIFLDMKKKEE